MKVLGVETRQSWGTPDNENVILNIELLKRVKLFYKSMSLLIIISFSSF